MAVITVCKCDQRKAGFTVWVVFSTSLRSASCVPTVILLLSFTLHCLAMSFYGRDGTGSGFLTRDPTRPDPVVERCKPNARQRLDSSIS